MPSNPLPLPLERTLTFGDFVPMLGVLVGVVLVLQLVHKLVFRRQRILRTEPHFQGQLVLIALTLVGIVLFLLVLPVNDATTGQLLNLLGILLTAVLALSSTTVVANALAGLMVRSMRSFRPGDFIRCGDAFGRVTQRGLFFTEIQTEQRDLTTLPNQFLISNPVTVVHASGTIVSATLSLGYDVSHDRIRGLLEEAATESGLAEPFVLIRDLGDFSITYRVSGFLAEVTKLVSARSRLRAKVLDVLHENGVEIVSPTFMNQRQLRADEAIMPDKASSRSSTAPAESEPESIVFDKAEEAQQLEELVEAHDKLRAELKELEANKADEQLIATRRAAVEGLEQSIASSKEAKDSE